MQVGRIECYDFLGVITLRVHVTLLWAVPLVKSRIVAGILYGLSWLDWMEAVSCVLLPPPPTRRLYNMSAMFIKPLVLYYITPHNCDELCVSLD